MGDVYRGKVKAISPVKTQSAARPFPSSILFYISDQQIFIFFTFWETWFKSGQYTFMLITISHFKVFFFFFFFWMSIKGYMSTNVASGIIIIIKILVRARLLSLPCNKIYSAILQYFSSYNCSPDVSNKHTNVIHKGDLWGALNRLWIHTTHIQEQDILGDVLVFCFFKNPSSCLSSPAITLEM